MDSGIYIWVQRSVGAMEGVVTRTCINVFRGAWCVGECTNLINLRCVDPRFGIDCLPNGKQSIHISIPVSFGHSSGQIQGKESKEIKNLVALRVMKPENRIESRVRDDAHMSSISH